MPSIINFLLFALFTVQAVAQGRAAQIFNRDLHRGSSDGNSTTGLKNITICGQAGIIGKPLEHMLYGPKSCYKFDLAPRNATTPYKLHNATLEDDSCRCKFYGSIEGCRIDASIAQIRKARKTTTFDSDNLPAVYSCSVMPPEMIETTNGGSKKLVNSWFSGILFISLGFIVLL
ncbi:hypothetical protein BS50DRAFT_184982 [Corynespora cassiicola Philippines]|uniref:Uncharacterized protein n=1 Tax=Corynespora cassiicola Philippines TaxID=1448308 RepID=A0A2T2P6I5_CORCC|nr:hypothetical protein BS50DRAFT_184982 [Corynespora cassiicola Philippines]